MNIVKNIKGMKRELWVLLTSIVCSGLISALTVSMLMPHKVVQVNLQSIVNAASQQYANANLTSDQQLKQSQIFAAALSKATQQYARDNEAVVVVSSAVVAGAYDATNDIAALTIQDEKEAQ